MGRRVKTTPVLGKHLVVDRFVPVMLAKVLLVRNVRRLPHVAETVVRPILASRMLVAAVLQRGVGVFLVRMLQAIKEVQAAE
jgi:hypothetical protein